MTTCSFPARITTRCVPPITASVPRGQAPARRACARALAFARDCIRGADDDDAAAAPSSDPASREEPDAPPAADWPLGPCGERTFGG